MEVLVNERLVKQRARIGRYATFLGLAMLAGGLVASFSQKYLFLSFGGLILGFLLSQLGNYFMMRWGRKPRADQVLATALKGLDRRCRLYNYLLPASHVLIGPVGLYVFVVKHQAGQIRCEGRRWSRKFSIGRALLMFGEESLGNPTDELALETNRLTKFIRENQPDLQPSIRGAIVFANPRVQLSLTEPAVPVLQPKQLKPFMRRPAGDGGYLDGEERRALVALFDRAAGVSTRQSETVQPDKAS